jgi:glycosyltransferase involved in cell wall biosynthesis
MDHEPLSTLAARHTPAHRTELTLNQLRIWISPSSRVTLNSRDRPLTPLVSIIVVTYNHEGFIQDAIDGILSQRVDFDYEILVCEDCSTDRTRDLVLDIQRRHPDRVHLFLSTSNQNDNQVFTRAWKVAQGRYIAFIDGDDFWTDPLKLSKQVAYLENHPEVFVCGHAVRQIDHTGKVLKESKFDIFEDQHLSQEELASGTGYPIPTLSLLFRNNRQIPDHAVFNKVFNADTFMLAYFSNFGRGFISREVMGVHRVHPGSVWSLLGDDASADYRNATLRRIPVVIEPPLRALAYYALLRHSLYEDRRFIRKVCDIPFSVVMMLIWLRRRSIAFLAPRWLLALFRTS